MSKVAIISSDCHAGALPEGYKPYLPSGIPRGRRCLVAGVRPRNDEAYGYFF